MNQLVYEVALWLDGTAWSTGLHESYYLYNWIETIHVLTLVPSLGLLLVIDLRILGYALPNVPAMQVAHRLQWPMLLAFTLMVVTGALLFYAIPVRSAQSLWLRIKLVLLMAAAINAVLFHRQLARAGDDWGLPSTPGLTAPLWLRVGAALSILFWILIVICGRLIAYDWFDCVYDQSAAVNALAGCIPGQVQF